MHLPTEIKLLTTQTAVLDDTRRCRIAIQRRLNKSPTVQDRTELHSVITKQSEESDAVAETTQRIAYHIAVHYKPEKIREMVSDPGKFVSTRSEELALQRAARRASAIKRAPSLATDHVLVLTRKTFTFITSAADAADQDPDTYLRAKLGIQGEDETSDPFAV